MADQSESEDLDTDRHRLSNHLMEDGNMVQTSNMYRVMLGHDGQSVSKPVDAQLFNVDLSSVPLPPAAATAVTTVEDPMASTSHSSHRQTHTPRIPRTMNDYSPPSGSTVSSIALPPTPPLPITTTTTTMHLPFPSSSDLSSNGSGIAQLASTVPQPVPPPLPLPLASVSTVPPLPPTPVPPVPPPPVMPVPPPVGLLSLPTSSIGSYNSIAQCSTILTDNVDRETSYLEDKKDGPGTPPKVLSASLESHKVANPENSHQPGRKTGSIIRFSLKSPDGGGKPKVSFQIKRKNRPIVGDKSESIAEEEDIVNSNPGQFVTRKREMFKPAEVESVTPQQLAFIKSLEVLENVQKKSQTSPTASESSLIPEFQSALFQKSSEKPCEKPAASKLEEKYFDSSVWEKVESSVCDKAQEHVMNEKASSDKTSEQSVHDLGQEQLNYAMEKSSDNLIQENFSNDLLHKERSSEKSASEKVHSTNTPEKCYDTQSSLDRFKGKSTRDRSREHSGQDRSYERSTRDRPYDNKSSSDKPRDKSTRERSGRESSHDRSTRGSSYERGTRDKSQERGRDWDRSRDRSTQDRSYDRSTRDRSHERSNRDRLMHDRFRERSNRDRDRSNPDKSRERSTRERSRERSTRERSRERYLREKSYERSSREKSNERCISEKGSERSSCERSKNRMEGLYDYRSNQRRSNTWDRRNRWTERYDERSSYDKYDDGRYNRNADRHKRDMYDSRVSTSHYYDDEHYGRSHHDDKRSRQDEKTFHGQDRHSRSDDNYADRYDRRSRRSVHSSEERSSDLDSCLKSSEDTTSPCRQQYLGGKASNISSGISAISVHYSQASDSDSSPVRNMDSSKPFEHLQFNSAPVTGTNSATAPNKQLTLFGQENQSQNYNKMNECEGDTYNYGDSTPVRDEPNDYEINFSQNTASVNTYSGFSQLYPPASGNVTWLNTGLEPTQSIEVSQRLPGGTTIPTVLEDSARYPSAVLTDVQQRGQPANLLSISSVTTTLNNPTQINIGLANTNFEEHTRIPAVLEDFPKVSHSNGLSQSFGRTSNICSQNRPPIVGITQNQISSPNVVQKAQFSEPVCIPPPPPPPPLVTQLAPMIAPGAPYMKATAYGSKTEPARYSDFLPPQKTLVQPPVVFSAATVESEKKSTSLPIVVPHQEFCKSTFKTSEEHKTVSKTPVQLPQLFTSTPKYSVTDKMTLSQSVPQSLIVNSSQDTVFEKPEDIPTNSSSKISTLKPVGSSTADYSKYFPLQNKDNTKIDEESLSSKSVNIVSDVTPSSSSSLSSSNTPVLDIKPDPLKESISVDVVVENVSIIEPPSQVAAGQLCSSIQFLSTDTNKKVIATKSDVDEVSSSECTLSKKQSSASVVVLSSSQDSTDTQHPSSEASSLPTAPKGEETVTIKIDTEKNVPREDVSTVGLKDNFDEELMDVDSPGSSGNIETTDYCDSETSSVKGSIKNDENTSSENTDSSQKSLASTVKFQTVASTVPLPSVDTTESNLYTRTEGKAVSESKIPTPPSKDQEISSSGILGLDHCDVKNSENLVSTTEYRLKKPYNYCRMETSTKPIHEPKMSGKLQDFSVASDCNAIYQSSSQNTDRSSTVESSQSSMVTSSDENFTKPQGKSQSNDNQTDSVSVKSEIQKDTSVTQQKDNNSNNQGSVNQVSEARPIRAGRRRPRTRWDNAGPTPILNALESELATPSSQENTTQNKETSIVQHQAELEDNLQKSMPANNSSKSVETTSKIPSIVPDDTIVNKNDSTIKKTEIVSEKPESCDSLSNSQNTMLSSSSSDEPRTSDSVEQISPVTKENRAETKQVELQISSSNDSEMSNERQGMTKSFAATRTVTETSVLAELEKKSSQEESLLEDNQAKAPDSVKSSEGQDGTGSESVTPSQAKGDDISESNSKEDRDSIISSKPTSPETSIKDEDGCKDEDTESVSSQKSLKGTKKNEGSTRVSSGTPAPRRSGRIRSLEEKRVREKEEKKDKDCKTKKEKKQDIVKAEEEKPAPEEQTADDLAPAVVKDETLEKEVEEKKEGRRTRTRWSTKEEDEQKEETDRKKRDNGSKSSAKEDNKKVIESVKESPKPKRMTRNKKQIEADKLKANETKMETEGKPGEAESQTQKSTSGESNLPSVDLPTTPVTVSGQSLPSSQMKKFHLAISYPGVGQSQSPLPVPKETSAANPATPDQSAAREPKKEDPLMSVRPLKVKSRWRRTMEAEWLSASASISSSTTGTPSTSSTITSVATSNTPSPQLSPSTVALSSSSAASTLQPLSTSSSLSSYTPQMSDNLPLPSQANIYPTQQQTPRPSSPQIQPSIQISSTQLSPQQKPQPVVSSTFQGPEDLPITAKTISTIVNEDPRKSYLQKPAFETILEEEEDKKRDAGTDVARDTLSASIKDVQVRPDSEADKENSRSYEEIVDNIYLTERKRSKQMREVRRMVCDCTTSHEDREQGLEACGEDCLNRMLMIECGSRCPCSEYCNNKRFSRHQYVKVTAFKTETKGLGLMTLEDLPPHTFVMEYVGEVLDYKEFKNRTKQYAKNGQEHYYFMSLNADEVIDATYRGNKSRFINHSCDPNCETQKWTVNGMLRIGFFTKKSIKAGTEMTFDYQFESKQAQKCYCSAECCRGTIGGKKKTPVKSKKKAAASDKKKKEFEDESNVLKLNKQWNNMSQSDDDDGDDDGDNDDEDNNDDDEEEEDEQAAVKQRPHDGQIKLLMLEEEMERMSQLDGLKNKEHVLNLCRLMVRAESNDHRLSILRILQGTNEQACLRLFLDYHGLPLLWSWMADIGKGALYLKSQILGTLKMLPITNKTILQESKILPMVVRWANELKMTAEREVETEQSNDNSSQAGTPSSVASRDERPPKKKVKFADETSSDSEMSECSRLSGMIYLNEPMAKNGLNEVADSSDMQYPEYSNQSSLYVDELDETRSAKPVPVVGAAPKTGILIKPELQKELSSESSSSPVVEDKVQSTEAESSSLDILDKCSTKEKTEDEVSPKDDDSSNEVKVAADEKNFDSSNLSSVVSLASDLLKYWSDLKEVFKIPKKEKVEERKRTERELERDRMDRKRRYEVSPDKGHSRFRSRSDRRREEVQELLNPNRPRHFPRKRYVTKKTPKIIRVLLPTPPKLSKEERRQQFEAQVRAQDEMAEYQKQQEAAYMQQQQEYMQQQYMGGEMAGYDYYVQQDPNMSYPQDPNMAYPQDPNMAYPQDPNAAIAYQADPNAAIAYQADPNAAMYPQDPNTPYQDPSVYHGYHLPPPSADPNAYPMPSADASAYPMAPADVNTAYQMPPADSSAYQIHPSDPNAYAMRAADPTAYQVPPPDPATYQATSTDQTGYIQADSSFQIPVPPPATPVPPDSSYPPTTPAAAATGSSPAVAQKPQAVSEGLLEHCYIAGQTAATVPDVVTSQAVSTLNAIPTMTPTYIEPGSSTPAIYPNAPATPVYQVPSKFLTTPPTTATAAAAYSQATPSVPPPCQSASVPQLPPVAPQLQSASGLASIPPSAQQNAPLTPVYVQQSQAPSQPPPAPQAPPPAPAQVYYPTPPQAMVVPPPQHHYPQPPATTPAVPGSQVVQIDQGLLALQQVKQLQQQLQIQNIVLSSTTPNAPSEDDPPPPPSPPKPKVTKLPPNWKIAKDSEGKNYYYHTVTRQTQWDLPTWDQEEQDDMDLGTPTHDEPQNKSKKKATTAAADTSSEIAKRSKESFRNKMSQWIVSCLNPYRKPDCRLGRISSTDDFKHLARKLTHHVMAKELKHCKHPEDLEVNENVKAKAKDYIKKYMSKFGANYKKAQSPTPDD